jgi:hypothetical protein
MTSRAQFVTEKVDFSLGIHSESEIFSVRSGIPMHEAFEQLYGLLDGATAAVDALAMEGGGVQSPSPLWSISINLNMAQALLEAMHSGFICNRQPGSAQ